VGQTIPSAAFQYDLAHRLPAAL